MAISNEVRRLERAWQNETLWPKRLEWLEIEGLRGWTGQRVEFAFPIVAIAGENGSGKSTIIQAAASIYREAKGGKYASEFFPKTAWDKVENAAVRFGYVEGKDHKTGSVRKPTERWKGNADRPIRPVQYIDLSRIVPVAGRLGYAKIAKSRHKEVSATLFDESRLARLSSILGNAYSAAKMALTDVDSNRVIPVLRKEGSAYSGYHQGQGETTIAELIQKDLPKYGLFIIDEIESSLHPRAQRRLIRDLASVCRERELQIIITTHSPYILEELPSAARLQIYESGGKRQVMTGVSPQFAMTQMDDIQHPECELYVEDQASKTLLTEILSAKAKDLIPRSTINPCGASSVGYQLGVMVAQKRFKRPVGVFLDGDCAAGDGCHLLPGLDAPERVVFSDLATIGWAEVWLKVGRDVSEVADACSDAMTLTNHHDWIQSAANRLFVGGNVLWQAMCSEWVKRKLPDAQAAPIVNYVEDRLAEFA
jgi:predicted ATPase